MPIEINDADLVAACTQGDALAWETLVDRYKRLVYSIPLHAGLSPDDAADVFQTVFIALFEHLDGIRDGQGVAKWLITTAQRESWNVSRKRQREPLDGSATLALAGAKDRSIDPEQYVCQLADNGLMMEALERLGGRCRTLLWLLYCDPREFSYERVSEEMKMPLGSIGPTRARCLDKLRQILRAMGMV